MDDIGTCAKRYPWVGSPPRFILQAEVEKALISANKADYDPVQIEAIAKECLASIQKQTDAWLATESKIPVKALKPFSMWRFGFPFFVVFLHKTSFLCCSYLSQKLLAEVYLDLLVNSTAF